MQRLITLSAILLAGMGITPAAILVGPGGSGVQTFDLGPEMEEWATLGIAGSADTVVSASALDLVVQLTNAYDINKKLPTTAIIPPAVNGLARWNSNAKYLQTAPAGVTATLLQATLLNNSGGNLARLTIGYDFLGGQPVSEQIPGLRVYYSFVGTANNWQLIPDLSTGTTGHLSATLELNYWADGQWLYLLWADDDGTGADSYCAIDNFYAFSPDITGVAITSPGNSQVRSQRRPITLAAAAQLPGTVTNVIFYGNGNPLGQTAWPFQLILTNAPTGTLQLWAVAADNLGNARTSAPVTITVISNLPPQVTITAPANGEFGEVGASKSIAATASDEDGAVARVDFHLDGRLFYRDSSPPYQVNWCDQAVGAHVISAIAVDDAGGQGTANVLVTIANPPAVTVLVPNGATWKFLNDGSDQGTAWRTPEFDDRGWSNGVAEFGYGDITTGRPEMTTVRSGPNSSNVYVTTYFRHNFVVKRPSVFTNLVVCLLRDDGGVVYLNGTEVFRSNLPEGPLNYLTQPLQPATYGEGAAYFTTNASPGVLIPGANVVAVEIHQFGSLPGALSFDLMVWGQPEAPELTVTRLNRSRAELAWPYPSSEYLLQCQTNLNSGIWESFLGPDYPANGLHHVPINYDGDAKFFRLIRR